MSRGPVKLSKIHLKRQGAWGTPETTFAAVDLIEVTGEFIPPANREALQPDVNKADFAETEMQPGSKAAFDVTFSFVPHALPTGFEGGNPTATVEHQLFEDALGTLQATGFSSAREFGVSTTKLFYNDGEALEGWTGQGLLVPKTGGGYVFAWPKQIDLSTNPDEAVLITAVPVAPENQGIQYGSVTCALTLEGLEALPFTMQFASAAGNAGFRCWDGRVASISIEVTAKAQPTISVTMRFLDWTFLDALDASPYTFPRAQFGPAILADSYGPAAANCPAGWTLTLTQNLTETPRLGSAQGVSRLTTNNRTVEVVVRQVIADAYSEAWGPPGITAGTLCLGATTTPGRAMAVLLPLAVRHAQAQLANIEGLWGLETTYRVRTYAGDTPAAGSTVENTPFRIAFA
jgi:hypothetical protein